MKLKIFHIQIEFSNNNELLDEIFNCKSIKTIGSVNQDFLNLAYKDKSFTDYLNQFDLIHPDGIGVIFAKRFLYGNKGVNNRITCPDLMLKVLDYLNKIGGKIFLLGAEQDTILKTCEFINSNYRNIAIVGYNNGYFDINNPSIFNKINESKCDFLFVGMGSKIQEEWIIKWKEELNVNKIYAVGGAFRVLANERKRGPVLLQKLGLEWFVRLVTEPKYVWKRYLIGIPLFIFRIIKFKFSMKKESN